MTNAIVYTPDGRQFQCETNDFTLKSLFLCTSESFAYGTVLKLTLGDVVCHGEVVFVSAQAPVGLGLSLRVAEENIGRLTAVMEGRPMTTAEAPNESSLPLPTQNQSVQPQTAIPQPAPAHPQTGIPQPAPAHPPGELEEPCRLAP